MMDAMVVGGGLAGAALATRLARAGREVVLLEREAGPVEKVCGEFLSQEACTALAALGLDLKELGAVPVEAVRLCARTHAVTVPLPFAAFSLSRRVLDEALLECAARSGVEVRRGSRVDAVRQTREHRWTAQLSDGADVEASTAFLATGKHDLPGQHRPGGLQNDLVAFKLHWRLEPAQAAALGRSVELILFEGGYAGLQAADPGWANLCLLVRRSRLRFLGQRWGNLLAALRAESPHLAVRLAGADPRWSRPLALSAIPYGLVRRRTDGLWRLGDQAAVIPSFSGDGMAIALHSAELAAKTWLSGRSAETYQHALSRDVAAQVLLATVVSHGLVHRSGQAVIGAAARVWPGLMSRLALRTRVVHTSSGRAAAERPS